MRTKIELPKRSARRLSGARRNMMLNYVPLLQLRIPVVAWASGWSWPGGDLTNVVCRRLLGKRPGIHTPATLRASEMGQRA